ncbi:uncharacterized protein [Haliotis asinina]|uniref:uncharacterized protein isoform X3 n=1 Tax=Haliotis asinina TaxID=109174 RepID=UPI003531CC31
MNHNSRNLRRRDIAMTSTANKSYLTFNEDEKGSNEAHENEIKRASGELREREDIFLWSGGIAFIVILIGVIFGIGHARHWDALSGHTHNISATSRDRFLPEPFVPEPGVKGRYGVEPDSRWYYWKLPPDRVTSYTRLFAWLCYIGHQVLAWTVLYIAQHHKAHVTKSQRYSTRLTKWNYISFGLHVFFHLLHLAQTHTTYDALASDVSIASSQSSVIMILVFIMLIEYRDRGIVFLWPTDIQQDKISRTLRLDQAAFSFIRRYHGYAFAWGAIYTFWYHPMENTWGHALGFFHTWIIMLQGSLIYTNFHLNKYWRLLLETWVTVHGTVVAIQTGGPDLLGTKLWPMFCFGFSLLIVVSQIFSLPFWRKVHAAFRVIPLAIYIGVTLYMYSWIPDVKGRTFVRLQEVVRIPAVYYLGFLYAWILFFAFHHLQKKLGGKKSNPSTLKKAIGLVFSVAMFSIFLGISVCIQWFDVQQVLTMMMIMLVFVFVTGVCLVCVAINQTLPSVQATRDKNESNKKTTDGKVLAEQNGVSEKFTHRL